MSINERGIITRNRVGRRNRFRDRTVYYTFAVQDSAELTSFFFYEQPHTTCLHDKILALKNGQ